MSTNHTPAHLDALQTVAADARRTEGPAACAPHDLRENGSRAAPTSVRAVLTLVQQTVSPGFNLPTRLRRAAAELDDAVQCANLAYPHVLDHHALFLVYRTVARVTGHLLTDVE
ncbi:hypothetical protein [Deinococcus budaensis]|uniref:Uncharacterized protein n=1 Tax=Deinococcus budaensis TaxID=1665626 RepID=A0A7W8LR89_9DEIO|nr:hypothetical protein [Deinococcus budaensis]MBB5235564.1 hypothetical protein [Deinococcus budaensis]